MNISKLSFKKKATAAIAAVAVAVLLLTGTYAWQQTIRTVNEFMGTAADKNSTLHDDYDNETGDKDVYVENTSDKSAIFVRVMFQEVMDLTKNIAPSDPNWNTHIPNPDVINCTHSNETAKEFHDYFTWEMGGQKYYMPAAAGTPLQQDINMYDGTEEGVKQTPFATVITMAAYQALADKTDFVGWVYDTDGYVYWSQPLLPQKATGLLLNKVNTSAFLDGSDYYYAINVVMETVDYADLPMWTQSSGNNDGKGMPSVDESGKQYDESSNNAKEMLNNIAGIALPTDPEEVTITGIAIKSAPTKTTYISGDTFDSNGMVITVTYSNGSTEDITHGFNVPTAPLTEGTDSVTISYGGQTVTQTINVLPA